MLEILKSLTFEDLPTKPPLVGRPKMSEDLQQAVALLVGWDGTTRRLVRVSPTGTLYVASPRVKGTININADNPDYLWQGEDIPTSEVLIKARIGNSGFIWVNVNAPAAVSTGYELDGGEWVSFSISNLHSLYIYSLQAAQKAMIIYTI